MFIKKKSIVVLLFILAFVFVLAGCSQDNPENISVSGIVTEGRSGPTVENAKIKIGNKTAVTNENGKFNINISKGKYDLIAIKDGYGSVKVQSLNVNKDVKNNVELVMLKTAKSITEPPTINLKGIERNQSLTGKVEYKVNIKSPIDIKSTNIKLANKGFESNKTVSRTKKFKDSIKTSDFTNGKTHFTIEVRDINNNVTKLTLPIIIKNSLNENIDVPNKPGSLTGLSMTWGKTNEFFGERDKIKVNINNEKIKNDEININTSNLNDQLVYNYLILPQSPRSSNNIDGYQILRSFDNENYKIIGEIQKNMYFDFDSKIKPKKPTYYKVKAYNSGGLSKATDPIMIKPLPKINLELIDPADNTEGVSIDPTFRWELSREFVSYEIKNSKYSETATYAFELYSYAQDSKESHIIKNVDHIKYSDFNGKVLTNNKKYNWDISSSVKDKNGNEHESQTSIMYPYNNHTVLIKSMFGSRTGSLNGAFTFITKEN